MDDDIRIFNAAELRADVPLDGSVVEVVERAFAALAEDRVIMPPILSMSIAARNADVDVKTAYIEGFDAFAVKISPGFFDNPKIGLPTTGGMMALFAADTGRVRAILLDHGYLTDLRTAAAGAVAAKCLAGDVAVAGVIGAGEQARWQMRAAYLVKPFARGVVWARDAAKAGDCAAELTRDLGVPVRATAERRHLVEQSQLVITTTPSRAPLIEAAWLHPGLHITAMGSDTPGKNEIAPDALALADLYVADHAAQCAELGELATAIAAGTMSGAQPPELGQIVTGQHPGRTDPRQITIADLTGTGAQDTAIASHAVAKIG